MVPCTDAMGAPLLLCQCQTDRNLCQAPCTSAFAVNQSPFPLRFPMQPNCKFLASSGIQPPLEVSIISDLPRCRIDECRRLCAGRMYAVYVSHYYNPSLRRKKRSVLEAYILKFGFTLGGSVIHSTIPRKGTHPPEAIAI